jgi:hypothetical protein
VARKRDLLLQLFAPLLTPIEADEIRAEIIAMDPRVHLVMPAWSYLEVRGISEEDAAAIVESLTRRRIRFKPIEASGARKAKAQVQVAVETGGM